MSNSISWLYNEIKFVQQSRLLAKVQVNLINNKKKKREAQFCELSAEINKSVASKVATGLPALVADVPPPLCGRGVSQFSCPRNVVQITST